MATALAKPDVIDVPDGYERLNDQLVEASPMGQYASEIANLLSEELKDFCKPRKLGRVRMDQFFKVPYPGDRRRIRKPDLAYISHERWPEHKPLPYTENPVNAVPNIVLEVASRTGDAENVLLKTRQNLKAGVESVWIVYPGVQEVHSYDQTAGVRVFMAEQSLDGGAVLPGFTMNVSSIFPPIEPGTMPVIPDDDEE